MKQKTQIKYNIKNTPIPVMIDALGEVMFDIPDEDMKNILAKDSDTIEKYQKKLDETMDYLILEGFLELENNAVN